MLRATFNGSDARLAAALRRRGVRVIEAIVRKTNGLLIRLQSHIVAEKLSGQVLKHRSGKLAASVRVQMAAAQGTSIVGAVLAAGGPAWYGKIHEFGGTRAYLILPRNKKALAFFGSGATATARMRKEILTKMHRGKASAQRAFAASGDVVVRSVQHPPLPMRSFMRMSLAEMRETMFVEIRAAAAEAMKREG